MKPITELILSIVLICLLASCSVQGKPDSLIIPDVSSDELNTRINLAQIDGVTKLRIGEILFLDVTNISHTSISFPADYGIRIFVEHENQWTETKNDFGYGSGTNLIPPQEVDELGDAIVSLYPVIDNLGQAVTIRVVVIGTVLQNDEPASTKTGAYIELVLQP